MDKRSAPLYEKLVSHMEARNANFHVPGHKGGLGADTCAGLLKEAMSIDFTEITGLDDLHHPTGVIRDAQQLAADCFGAEETFFLVGGSTAGNLALIMSTCQKDDILIVQRNVHKSVLNGIALAGARAVFLPPRWDAGSRLAAGVAPQDIRKALERYPEAKGVLLTNPNYYGMADDLSEAAEVAHRFGKPLLVDEAHGAHLGFHPELSRSALSCGADGVVQSTHKMLTAMTMGAMLHLQGSLVDRDAVRRSLAALQSSSPSYPILASLDLSRRQMHTDGYGFLDRGLKVVRTFREKAKTFEALSVLEHNPDSSYGYLDPFKITVRDRTGTLTGFGLQNKMEEQGCIAEMADAEYALFHFSPATPPEDADRLFQALMTEDKQLRALGQGKQQESANILGIPLSNVISLPVSLSWQMLSRSSVRSGEVSSVPLKQAAGLPSAEMVVPYPPGVPAVYPGERLSPALLEYLQALARAGARFQGAADATLQQILVYHSGG